MEEEEKMVTRRRSSRLGRSSNLQNAEEDELDDEISIWDDFGEETEMFGEDEEGRYTDACRRKRCVVKILQMKNFDMGDSNSDEESESFDLGNTSSEESAGDYVEDILATILNKVFLLNKGNPNHEKWSVFLALPLQGWERGVGWCKPLSEGFG